MKKIISMFTFIIGLYGGSYTSVHQLIDPKGLLEELTNEKSLDKGIYGNKIDFRLTENAIFIDEKRETWCGNTFDSRYKIYIPGKKYIPVTRIVVGVYPNSTIYMLMHFVPQKQEGVIGEINWLNYKFYRYKTKQDIKNFFDGKLTFVKRVVDVGYIYFDELGDYPSGWLYVQFIGATNIETSQYKRDSYNVIFAFEYRKFTKSGVEQFIRDTEWDIATHNPVEGFDEIIERMPYCRDYGAVDVIKGKQTGIPGTSLLDGNWEEAYSSNYISSSSSTSSSYFSGDFTSVQTVDTGTQNQTDQLQEDLQKKREECESEGGKFLDGVCIKNGSQKVNSSQESVSSSIQAFSPGDFTSVQTVDTGTQNQTDQLQEDLQKKREECESEGGKFLDGVCIKNGSQKVNSSQEQKTSYISSLDEDDIVIDKVNNKKFPIAGYWIHYGPGQFDWLYVSKDGQTVGKLNGEIKWERLESVENIEVTDDSIKIIFINKQEEQKIQTDSSNFQENSENLEKIQENKINKTDNSPFPE